MKRMSARRRKNKKEAPSDTIATTQRLKQDVKKFEARRDFLGKKSNNEFAKAKALNKKNDKKTALLHLKKKKLYDTEIAKLDSGILTLEEQIIGLESGAMTIDLIAAQERAKKAQEKLMSKISIEKLDKLQAEIGDQQGDLEEINLMLTENGINDYEDDDLLAELDEMDVSEFEDELENKLPVPPKARVKREEFNEEEEELLKDLLSLEEAPTEKPKVPKPKPLLAGGGGSDEEALLLELEQSMT